MRRQQNNVSAYLQIFIVKNTVQYTGGYVYGTCTNGRRTD